MSMSKQEQMRQAAIGDDDDSDDEQEGLTRRRGGGGVGSRGAAPFQTTIDTPPTTNTMESTELAARESARRFLWDEDELEDVTPIPGSVIDPASEKKSSTFKGGFRFPLSPPAPSRKGRGSNMTGSKGMAGMQFKFNDASFSGEAEEHITTKSRYGDSHRINPVVAACLGCYHVVIGSVAFLVERLCSPTCRRVFLALLGLVLIGLGVHQGLSHSEGFGSSIQGLSTDRLGYARDKLLQLEVTNVEYLDATDSPQYNALHWIAKVDEAKVDIDDDAFVPRYVLAVLFFATSGAPIPGDGSVPSASWNAGADSWMTTTTICQWTGIVCVPGVDSILSLNLTDNLLQGSLPLELQSLTDLETLDLSMNEFQGSIPPNILLMPSLVHLNLRANKFTGPVPSQVDETRSHLRQLNLGENKLTGNVPEYLNRAVQLNALSLNKNLLVGPLPDLSPLKHLNILYLDGNALSGSLADSFFRLTNLNDLSLAKNKLSGTINPALSGFTDLTRLRLQGNAFSGTLPDLGQATQLTEVNLAWNKLDGRIPESYGNLQNAELLLLDQNLITGTLPTTIGLMTSLKTFYLAQNSLVGGFPTEIGRLTNLHDLRIQGNGFTGPLPSELGQCTKLENIYMEYNFFDGGVPVEFGNLKELKMLKLDRNGLEGTVPAEVCLLASNNALAHLKVDCHKVQCACCENCN